jgi:hypothetical protein
MQLAAFASASPKWHFGDCGEICGYPTAEKKKGVDDSLRLNFLLQCAVTFAFLLSFEFFASAVN